MKHSLQLPFYPGYGAVAGEPELFEISSSKLNIVDPERGGDAQYVGAVAV